MPDERTPLLQYSGEPSGSSSGRAIEGYRDHHDQFCALIGVRPFNLPPEQDHKPHPDSLYLRAVKQRNHQSWLYMFTASFTNTLILSQLVLGATLTGLGASRSSPILVTIFGAANTIIAGLIAWLKSRGQPMRARMFKDDLERVVDEIENSATMWLGIARNVHGYDAIDTEESVSVRSEVARLTRLYDRAVKINSLNDPDQYSSGEPGDPHSAALKARSGAAAVVVPPAPAATASTSAAPAPEAAAVLAPDPEESPASKAPDAPKPKEGPKDDKAADPKDIKASGDKGKAKAESSSQTAEAPKSEATPQPTASQPPVDPDESPASSILPKKHSQDTSAPGGDKK